MQRWPMRIIILLVLGALINIAVALGLALRMPPPFHAANFQAYMDSFEGLIILIVDRPGEMRLTARRFHALDLSTFDTTLDRTEFRRSIPSRSVLSNPDDVAQELDTRLSPILKRQVEHWHGWPLLALRGGGIATEDPNLNLRTVDLNGSIEIALPYPFAPTERRLLVYQPVWPGFVFNTVFYALLLGLTWMLLITARRRYRLRHHRCPQCNYDLRGADHSACPECGCSSPHHRPARYDVSQ